MTMKMQDISSESIPVLNQLNANDSYIIRLEMIDGTSQLVTLSMDQAMALGVQNVCIENQGKPQAKCTSLLNYKIIHPSDLNLCVSGEPKVSKEPASGLPRGRPKKKPGEIISQFDTKLQKPSKVVKTSRTRYGRITKPPKHMENDYEKIVTNVKANMEPIKELDTVQFEPIKTTNNITEQPVLVSLDENPRKRNIPAQYRCPLCKKTYLGRNRMASHLKKYPEHRVKDEELMQDCNTWYFLIDTTLRANKGKRGEKFCKELINLIRNARIMAKNFLKPSKQDKTEYVVDPFLGEILNIQDGNYRFNESGICKDVNIFSFLLNDEFMELNGSGPSDKPENVQQPIKKYDFPKVDNTVTTPCDTQQQCVDKSIIDLQFDSDITDTIHTSKSPIKALFAFDNTSTPVKHNRNKTVDNELNKHDLMHIFNEHFIEKSNFSSAAPDILHNIKDNLFSENLLQEKEKDCKLLDVPTEQHLHEKQVDILKENVPKILNFGNVHIDTIMNKEKRQRTQKSDEFDLNKLVEFLPDAPVNNILDTSTGSDEIMNVDQFVNERFKNLTEPEDLPNLQNNSLSLELPVLECFNFNA